jgi:carboxylesterase
MPLAPWLLAGLLGAAAAAALRAAISRHHERLLLRHRPRDANGVVRGGAPMQLAGSAHRAVLVLHGFGDTPQSVAPVAQALHERGWTVHAPLLPGHGRTLRAMAAHGAAEWLAAARDAYAALRASHARVDLVAQSMGGALAVCLAVEHPPSAMVLLAPYLSMPRRLRRTSRLLRLIAPIVPYWRSNTPPRSIHDPIALANARAHWSTSARALAELRRVSDMAWTQLPALTAPTLVLQSREDNRIPPDAAQRAFDRIGAAERQLQWFTGRGHVLAVDYGHAEIADCVLRWLVDHGGAPQ